MDGVPGADGMPARPVRRVWRAGGGEVAGLCRKAGSTDVVDGFVALAALNYEYAPVITGHVDDISALLSAEPCAAKIVVRKP